MSEESPGWWGAAAVTRARIVPSPKPKPTPASATASAPGALQPAGSRGKLSYFHIYLVPEFLSTSDCSTIGKPTQLFWISHFLSLFFFLLNDLLLVNETSYCLGKERISMISSQMCVCVCQGLSAQHPAQIWVQEVDCRSRAWNSTSLAFSV